MKRVLAILAFSILSGICSAQTGPFRVGAMAGAQMSSFINGNPMPGWKTAALGSYQVNRLNLIQQLGITSDNTRSTFPQLAGRNHWQYLWADATSIISFVPIRKSGFDLGFGSGISIRRIISHTLGDQGSYMQGLDAMLHDWSYFLPIRVGVDFHLTQGGELSFNIEYQYQVRELYELPEYSSFNSYFRKLYSIGMSAAYVFAAP